MHEQTLPRASRQRASKRPAGVQRIESLPEPPPIALQLEHQPAIRPASSDQSPACKVGVAAITENMLKRKWSAIILRRMNSGVHDPVEITKLEPGLSPKVISERLRTMHRYALITRFPRPAGIIEYRVTNRGKKILEILDTISAVERQLDNESSQARKETYRTSKAV